MVNLNTKLNISRSKKAPVDGTFFVWLSDDDDSSDTYIATTEQLIDMRDNINAMLDLSQPVEPTLKIGKVCKKCSENDHEHCTGLFEDSESCELVYCLCPCDGGY